MKDLLLALPRLLRMITSLLGDRNVPLAAKIVLGAVAVYLASPVDLIPDWIPFVGVLDDGRWLTASIAERPCSIWAGNPASLDAGRGCATPVRWVPSRVKARVFGGQRGTA